MSRRTASRGRAKSVVGGADTVERAQRTAAPPSRRTVTKGGPPHGKGGPLGSGRPLAAGIVAAVRRVPTAAWICALVAFLNAASWSLISPPFEVPDEPDHFAYVQHLAETGRPPSGSGETFSRAETAVLNAVRAPNVRFRPSERTISTQREQRALERTLAAPLSRIDSSQAGVAASQPPLYYALETIPYALASSGTMLDQLALMRLLSAVMGGLTALFTYLFLREALPAARWAWTVGGLGVALAPLLGLMSGAVNPDALLFAVSAALFYCLARGFRRGLEPRLAAATGAVLLVGCLTKLTFLVLLPGAALGLLVLGLRARRARLAGGGHTKGLGRPAARAVGIPMRLPPREARRSLVLAVAVGAGAILLYLLVSSLAGRSGGVLSEALALNGKSGSVLHELSYIWQFYLPRLPGMHPYFHGFFTTRAIWFNGLVGLYGWLDTTFPSWVYSAALVPAGAIAALLARALFIHRGLLRSRLVEVIVYAAISLGVLVAIGVDDYIHHTPTEYAEPRYLLPLLALWGAVLALAARGAGRRFGPVVGALIVTLVLAHNLFSQLLVISRYYG